MSSQSKCPMYRAAESVPPRLNPLAIALGLALASMSLQSVAQEEARELEATTVYAEQNDPQGPDTGYHAENTLVGTKTDTPLREIPRSVSVVTRQQLEDRAALSISDALHYTAGVQAGYFGEDNKQDWFILRGFKQENHGLFQDSTRVYSSGFYSWQVDPYLLERVEVQRGAASVLYGQTPPGGVINLVSKRPSETTFGEVGLQYGSFDRQQLSLDVTGPLAGNDKVLYRITALARDTGTQVDDVDNDRLAIAPAVTLRFSEDTELTLLASAQQDNGDPMLQFLPSAGTVAPHPLGEIDTDTAVGLPDYETFERDQYTLGYEFSHRFNDTYSVQQNLRYGHMDINLRQLFFFFWQDQPAGELVRGLSYANGDADNLSVDNRLIGTWQGSGWDNTLLVGADYQQLKVNDESPSGWPLYPTPLNIFNPVYTEVPFDFDVQSKSTEVDQIGAYVQNQLKLGDRLVLLAGVRRDWAEFDFDNRTTGDGRNIDDQETTWNAGAAYLFDNGLTPYVSYSQFFLPVTDVDVFGVPFEPESGDQKEIGIKYQPPAINASFNAALFEITQENVRKAVGSGLTEQIGEVRSRGLELEAIGNLTSNLSVSGAVTLLDAQTTRSGSATAEEGKTPSQVADRMASLWAQYRVRGGTLDGLGFGAGARYVGETYGDNVEQLEVPSYTVFDAAVSYDWQNLHLQLNAKNLADKEYVATCDYYCWYGNRRNVVASVSYRW